MSQTVVVAEARVGQCRGTVRRDESQFVVRLDRQVVTRLGHPTDVLDSTAFLKRRTDSVRRLFDALVEATR